MRSRDSPWPQARSGAPDSLIEALRAGAEATPEVTLLRMGETSFSYAAATAEVLAVARGLRALGLKAGNRVGIMAPNRPETVWSWLGANAAGLVDVPFNTASMGQFLAYLVADAGPRMVIGTAEYLERIADSGAARPEFAVRIGDGQGAPFGPACRHMTFEELQHLSEAGDPGEQRAGTLATVMYTSGTTGPSKGVMLAQRYYPAHGAVSNHLSGLATGETVYCAQPLFHIDARTYLAAAVMGQGTLALGPRFSVSNFWNEVRDCGASVLAMIGTMCQLLYKQPRSAGDAENPARLIVSSSTPRDIHRAFEERFGVELIEAYGMTESVHLTATRSGATDVGSIGWPIPSTEIRIVDDRDSPVNDGEVGELTFRQGEPFMMMQGYWEKPQDTLTAWRNLWFHTGDFVKARPDGQLEYVGRKKDAIRRRGENVSAWEVEQAVMQHPDVLEAAALGVASEVGEEDVAILVVLRAGAAEDAAALRAFTEADLPKFAVPRYVEFVASLPKTPSERIAKGEVRARGITSAAWDAEATPIAR